MERSELGSIEFILVFQREGRAFAPSFRARHFPTIQYRTANSCRALVWIGAYLIPDRHLRLAPTPQRIIVFRSAPSRLGTSSTAKRVGWSRTANSSSGSGGEKI